MQTPACCVDAPCLHRYTVSYPGHANQVRYVRLDLEKLLEDCPAADDIIACASELATNAVQHSRSRWPGGTFTLQVEVSRGSHVRIAVDDNGGSWGETGSSPDCGRGLVIVAALAAQWGITAPPDRAGRTVWALFDWPDSR